MPTAASTLVKRTRRRLRDWPETDVTTASTASNGTTITVADATVYQTNFLLELEEELVRVTAASGTTVTIARAQKGSTAASHASGTAILKQPGFYTVEILDALNEGLDACFPLLYRPVATEYTGLNGTTYEFTVPTMSGIGVAIPFLYRVEIKDSGDTAFREERAWEVVRSEAPFIKFRRPPASGGILRLRGYGPFTHLASSASTLDTYFPVQAEYLLDLYATSVMLASGEAGRVRQDIGSIDQREQANRVGASMSASDKLLQRFQLQLRAASMPPMPKHVVSLL